MKLLLVVLGVVCVIGCIKADLTDKEKEKIKADGKACITETGVAEDVVKKAHDGTFADDPKLKAFALCMSKKAGFRNEKGEIQIDVIKTKLTKALGDAAAANKLIETCMNTKGSNEDAAFETFKCFNKNNSIPLSVL